MATKRPVLLAKDVADLTGEMVRLVPIGRPGIAVNLFDEIAEMLADEIARALNKSAGSVLHGARMAGGASEIAPEDIVTWIAVGGEAGDGKNCQDCLNLHGQEMTMEQFLDTQYTTACDGNCRCPFVPASATDSAREIEAIASGELEEVQP